MPPLRRNLYGDGEEPRWTSPGKPTQYMSITRPSGMKRVLSNGEITDVADAGYGGEPTVTHLGRVAYQPPPTIDVPASATNPVQSPWIGGGRSGWGQAGGIEVENTGQGNVVTRRLPGLDSVPDGAEVQHKVNEGPDGTMSTTTAKWIHRNVMATTRDTHRQALQQDELAQERLPAARGHELGLTRAQYVEGLAATAAGNVGAAKENRMGTERKAQAEEFSAQQARAGAALGAAGEIVKAREERKGTEATAKGGVEQERLKAQSAFETAVVNAVAQDDRYFGPAVKLPGGLLGVWDGKRYRAQRPPAAGQALPLSLLNGQVVTTGTAGATPLDIEALPDWEAMTRGGGASQTGNAPTAEQARAELERRRAAGAR